MDKISKLKNWLEIQPQDTLKELKKLLSKELKNREDKNKIKKSSTSAKEDLTSFFEDSYEKHHGW